MSHVAYFSVILLYFTLPMGTAKTLVVFDPEYILNGQLPTSIEDTFNKLLGAVYKHLGAPGKLFRGLNILNHLGRILRLWLKTMESLPELQF